MLLFDHEVPLWWVVGGAVFALVSPLLLFAAAIMSHIKIKPDRHRTVTILVLGDIGRSPRMMYHAESFAKSGWNTFLIGYGDTQPIPSLLETPRVHFLHVANPPRLLLKLPWIFRAPIRVLYQIFSVIWLAVFVVPCNTQVLMVQNPPSIPTLILAQFLTWATGCKLIIDWHNTGYSILAMRVGESSPLTRLAAWIERTFGRAAYAHLFVTKALRAYLTNAWGLQGKTIVLHDRPPSQFGRTEIISRLTLFRRVDSYIEPPLPDWMQSTDIRDTAITHLVNGTPQLRPDRPAFIVSSTSWTADEDFSLFLTALDKYQTAKLQDPSLPRLLVVITGKGELRRPFEAEVAKREQSGQWPDIAVRCIFVTAKDYPVILGCADLGVSMHQSSSGRDLPMKIVDMFGSQVPVLARRFECIDELVKDGRNGRVFDTGDELGDQLIETLAGYPDAPRLEQLAAFFQRPSGASTPRRYLPARHEQEWCTWDENWDAVMRRGVLDFKGRASPFGSPVPEARVLGGSPLGSPRGERQGSPLASVDAQQGAAGEDSIIFQKTYANV